MKHLRKNGGFTLVELVISIAVASLVTMAATTVLMLALRVNRQTADTATQQYTVRALLTTMEKAATSGSIQKVTNQLGSWRMIGVDVGVDENGQPVETEREIFSYNAFYRQILSNGIVVMEDVYASNAILENGLLSISLETREGIFETSVFVRIGQIEDSQESVTPEDTGDTKSTFLKILMSQLNSDGKINYKNLVTVLSTQENEYDPKSEETYYSEWYIGKEVFADPGNDWSPKTAWCACFVSWALAESGMEDPTDRVDSNGRKIQWYANVDDFLAYLVQSNQWKKRTESYEPTSGELVFFDWIPDDGVDDPQHVGVVIDAVDENNDGTFDYIITIEGNSAGYVAVRSYPLTDPRILGYGVVIS